jgi:glycerol uptake facilitator protein
MGALGWVGIAVVHVAAVGLPIYAFGHASGGHINPAVTAAFAALRRIDPVSAVVYVIAQLAGGVAAGLLFVGVRGTEAVAVDGMGATAPFPEVTQLQAVGNEAIITFFLMVVVMAMAVDDRTPDQFAGLAIGLTVGMGIFATGDITGASFNPARTLGPYVTNTVFGGPGLWEHAWIYVVGPTAGTIFGGFVYEYVVLDPQPMESGEVDAVEPAAD